MLLSVTDPDVSQVTVTIEQLSGVPLPEDPVVVTAQIDPPISVVNKVAKGELVINVADYPSPQAALDAALAGSRVYFPPGVYALGAALVVREDRTHIDAMGAHFTLSTWGMPAFDVMGMDECLFDIGLVEFTGSRGGSGGSYRGSAQYCSGAGVWLNGDRNYVRNLRTLNMPVGVFLSSYAGTGTYDRYGLSNHVGSLEVEGYDFGVLWVGQQNLVIDDLYGHDDTDDSAGANPTHLYYCSATTTFRSTGVTINKARCEDHAFGQPFQLKYCDGATLSNHTARNTAGLINIIDCHDLAWNGMQGSGILANNGQGAITFGAAPDTPRRPVLVNTAVVQAAGVNERAVSIIANDSQINGLLVETNHGAGHNTALNDVTLRGNKGRLRGASIRSRGTVHGRGFLLFDLSGAPATAWSIEDPVVENCRGVVDVAGGSVGNTVRFNAAAQTLTGTGTCVTITGSPVGGEYVLDRGISQGLYIATDPTWYTGGTDIRAAAQAAINAMPSSGGTLYIPPGSWTLSSPLILKPNVVVQGAGRAATTLTAAAGVFRWTATLSNVHIEQLNIVATTGHVFAASGGDYGIYNVNVRHCLIKQNDAGSSIMYHVSAVDYDNVVFEDCDMTRAATATVPAFYIVNSGGAANENRWVRCWARSLNATSTPFFHIESSSAGNYAYDNRFEDITGEQNPGGLIRALSTANLIIDNVTDYDASVNYAADLIYIGKSATGGLRSRYPVVRNCGRRGGTLGAGVYDINLPSGATLYALLLNPNHSSTGLKINAPGAAADAVTAINMQAGSLVAPAIGANVASVHGFQAAFLSGLYVGGSQVLSGAGTPEGAVTGNPGDAYHRTDGGAGTSYYVKETGAGNTGWSAVGGTAPTPNVQVFTAGGTWNKPSGATLVRIIAVGGGGGGGGGRRGAAGSVRSGGGGGGGGAYTSVTLDAADLPSSIGVAVGAAGAAGAAATVDNTDGGNGGTGGTSGLSGYASALGGIGGSGGTATGGSGGTGGGGMSSGANGGTGSSAGAAGNAQIPTGAGGAGAGGSGGGISTGNTAVAGGVGSTSRLVGSATVAGGAVDSTAPATGTAPSGKGLPGPGGGGGAASTTMAGQAGATPVGFGGGGGGGGASVNGANSGAGAAGAPGYVLIITTF